ncbi:unnamed protein product [Caenorhabditis bovis]|nr:unnamed protein product [Caenorhabditis bovis]
MMNEEKESVPLTIFDLLGKAPDVKEKEETETVEVDEEADEEAKIRENAMKLFDEAMSYNRRNSPVSTFVAPISAPSTSTTGARTYKVTYQPSSTPTFKYMTPLPPKKALESIHPNAEEYTIQKDVERLLAAATRVYGPKVWTVEEKKEFEKFCRLLRMNGYLNDMQKEELRNFYTKAYNLTDDFGTRSTATALKDEKGILIASRNQLKKPQGPRFGEKPREPTIWSSNVPKLLQKANALYGVDKQWTIQEMEEFHKIYLKTRNKTQLGPVEEEELKAFYRKAYQLDKQNSDADGEIEGVEGGPSNKATLPTTGNYLNYTYHIGAVKVFEDVFTSDSNMIPMKRRGRPVKTSPETDEIFRKLEEDRDKLEAEQRERNVTKLLNRIRDVHGYAKAWSADEKKEFEKFYTIFRDRQMFTHAQKKEIDAFFRTAYSNLKGQPIAQVATQLDDEMKRQAKKEYWAEYRKQYYRARKAAGLLPYRKKAEEKRDPPPQNEEEKKARKAAYLREWRQRKAEEKLTLNTTLKTYLKSLAI